ncbi:protein kinase domain containing protein [Stylonychia lemnae]|uniref:Protein kinase domain containing protein n=1 Tax=Stylonychia lemnae TaxID=5949 RepID=A0A078ABR5_STYLE|nr:protein kinase domain containing protein [Stylonychia lemnae]|eukprot:CDW79629.1 protein kinase domain containing protein [Stylonychia lemnae]
MVELYQNKQKLLTPLTSKVLGSYADDSAFTYLIINIILLCITVFIGGIIIILLVVYIDYQPLKKKCSRLILLSTIGNFMFCFIVLLQQITYNACLLDKLSTACMSESFSSFNCFMGFTLLIIWEPLAIIPYIMRAIRLKVIMKSQQHFIINGQKPKKWIKWISEVYLIRITLLWSAILIIFTLGIYFLKYANDKVIVFAPSYNVSICYQKTMNDDIQGSLLDNVVLHSNISVTIIMLFNFFECLFFMVALNFIKNIKHEFSIQGEIVLVLIVWFLGSFITLGIFIFKSNTSTWQYVSLITVARNLLILFITSLPPLYQTIRRQRRKSYLNHTNSLITDDQQLSLIGAINLNVLIQDKLVSRYFQTFVEQQYAESKEINKFYYLYTRISYYNESYNNDRNNRKGRIDMAYEIFIEHLTDESEFRVDLPKQINDRQALKMVQFGIIVDRISDIEEDLFKNNGQGETMFSDDLNYQIDNIVNEFLFMEVFAFAQEQLLPIFENFKRSQLFSELEEAKQLQKMFKEVLMDADIIGHDM